MFKRGLICLLIAYSGCHANHSPGNGDAAGGWYKALPDCPCRNPDLTGVKRNDGWAKDKGDIGTYHAGAAECFRSYPPVKTAAGNSGQQCCYDKAGNLITGGTGAGTPDRGHDLGAGPARNPGPGRPRVNREDGTHLVSAYWYRNVREPVYFTDALGQMIRDGYDTFIEIAPHPAFFTVPVTRPMFEVTLLKLQQLGLHAGLPVHLARKVLPTNTITLLLLFVVALPFSAITLVYFPALTVYPVGGVLVCIGVLWLNYLGAVRIFAPNHFPVSHPAGGGLQRLPEQTQ